MPKSHKPYPPELKRRLVEMVRAGRQPEELAEKFEPTVSILTSIPPPGPDFLTSIPPPRG
jgi:hypothetical protein